MKSTASIVSHSKKSPAKYAVLKTAIWSPLKKILDEGSLRGKDVLGIAELSKEEIQLIIETAELLKEHMDDEFQLSLCKGQSMALLFEKPSLRTRVTFELGIKQLGGQAIFLDGMIGQRESVYDMAKNLERWFDGMMARTFLQKTVSDLAEYAEIPVINGLSDLEHPCQALADLLTIKEHLGTVAGAKVTYVGDPNNVSNSLFLAALKLGADCAIACPAEYMPDGQIWKQCQEIAEASGSKLTLSSDPYEAVCNANVVYTDTWVSMGQEAESEVKLKAFQNYQLNMELLKCAAENALVMHCLPAHRGYEITDEVIDSEQSVVFDQAENRLHVQKAIMALTL